MVWVRQNCQQQITFCISLGKLLTGYNSSKASNRSDWEDPVTSTSKKTRRALTTISKSILLSHQATQLQRHAAVAACSSRLGSGFVSFVEGEVCIFWPPKDWKKLDPQQKLLQWQFAAMSLMKACGDNYMQVTQSNLLGQFNFLALPGTAAHRVSRNHPHICFARAGCIRMSY